jgi:hypothetical protein
MDLEKMRLHIAEAIGAIESRRSDALLEMASKVSEMDDEDDEECEEGCDEEE